MAADNEQFTTQRAYTLKLKGSTESTSWKEDLWRSHKLANDGVYAFGEWFLTMAGGLDHHLADVDSTLATEENPISTRRQRRIVLALSWLTVERGAKLPPPKYQVKAKPIEVLQEILMKRGLSDDDTASWITDCVASLSSRKRDTAVWVNRSAMFDDASKQYGLSRDDAASFVFTCFNADQAKAENAYFAIPTSTGAAKSKYEKPKDMVQAARSWLSTNWGSGPKSDVRRIVSVIQEIADIDASSLEGKTGLSVLIELASLVGPKPKTAEDAISQISVAAGFKGAPNGVIHRLRNFAEIKSVPPEQLARLKEDCLKLINKWQSKAKSTDHMAAAARLYVENTTNVPYRQNSWVKNKVDTIQKQKDNTNEYSAIFDLALRRLSSYHTWVLRAESERVRFQQSAEKMTSVPLDAQAWLEGYVDKRTESSGSLERYVLRGTALGSNSQWKQLVQTWNTPRCDNSLSRQEAVRQAQSNDIEGDFGDVTLYNALSEDDAWCVWHGADGVADASILTTYIDASEARADQQRFKVPCYCHPDPFEHPVYLEYGNSRWNVQLSLNQHHKIALETWSGTNFEDLELQWMSNRFMHDFALNQPPANFNEVQVSRADRLGRAAGKAQQEDSVKIAFDKNTPVRLQAGRTKLKIVQHLLTIDKKVETVDVVQRLDWFVTVSVPLIAHGPWIEYARHHEFPPTSSKHPFSPQNKERGRLARMSFEGLPHLRILGVDLGIRYGATCSVLETLSSNDVTAACRLAGQQPPAPDTLYFRLVDPVTNRHVWYRRIGPDTKNMPDRATGEVMSTKYPAPWARFDRQFAIKLPGEYGDTRMATPQELNIVNFFRQQCGVPLLDTHRIAVSSLTLTAVVDLRRAVKRHADLARITQRFNANELVKPGGRLMPVTEPAESDDLRTKGLTDLYVLATRLSGSQGWAYILWQHLINEAGAPPLPQTSELRTEQHKKVDPRLTDVAHFLRGHPLIVNEVVRATTDAWQAEEQLLVTQLRQVRHWIFSSTSNTKHHSGGLSVDRISAMQNFYQVSKAFFTRPAPDGRAANRNLETVGNAAAAREQYGQQMLDSLEAVREARARQLSSRIAEAALGIGREPARDGIHDSKRSQSISDDPRFAPCQVIAVEYLNRYRPDDERPHRENRQLMQWSVHKVQQYLGEECELHGIFLEPVSANYTSRQDYLSGAPGCRCNDIPVQQLRLPESRWSRHLVEVKTQQKTLSPEDAFLLKVLQQSQRQLSGYIRIAERGGEIFVSSDKSSPLAHGIQADMNASANIALRAATEHDWAGRWWYILVNSATQTVIADEYQGVSVIPLNVPLGSVSTDPSTIKTKARRRRDLTSEGRVYVWRAPDTGSLIQSTWSQTGPYWNDVKKKVLDILSRQFSEDIDKAE